MIRKDVPIPEVGEGKRGEDGYLGYLLRQAAAVARQAMEHTLADLGVTAPQFLVLTLVKAYPGHAAAEIARLAYVTPQTMTVIVRNLERDGLVRRTPPERGRAIGLTLTEAGVALLAQCRIRTAELERTMSAGLSADEDAVIRRWLVQVARLRPPPGAPPPDEEA